MGDEKHFEYVVLSYAHSFATEEEFNFAVILFDPQQSETGYCRASFYAKGISTILQFDPDADVEMLQMLAREIEQKFSEPESGWKMLHLIEDSFSTSIRCSQRKRCITENPDQELTRLVIRVCQPLAGS